MSLSPGTRVGPYEVLGSLGAGGMGEVYRARDTKLDRHVALKVLPDVFASDSDRLLRFDREAKVLAALNHPHIAHIHGLESASGNRQPATNTRHDPFRAQISARFAHVEGSSRTHAVSRFTASLSTSTLPSGGI